MQYRFSPIAPSCLYSAVFSPLPVSQDQNYRYWAGPAYGAGHIAGAGDIYKSTDNGATWREIEMGASLEQIQALKSVGNGIVFAGSGTGAGDGDLYKSVDYGETWTSTDVGASIEVVTAIEYLGRGS